MALPRENFKTEKGTTLALMNIKGKEYLTVQNRLIWFREEKPDWSISTKLIKLTDDMAIYKAFIKDGSGRVLATAHKQETTQGFPDFVEKAETGAVGRALAYVGYGTQFTADELDEGSRIVDAPKETKEKQQAPANPFKQEKMMEEAAAKDPGEYIIGFGKFKDKKLKDIPANDLNSWVGFMRKSTLKGQGLKTVEHCEAYLCTLPVIDEEDVEFNQAMGH